VAPSENVEFKGFHFEGQQGEAVKVKFGMEEQTKG